MNQVSVCPLVLFKENSFAFFVVPLNLKEKRYKRREEHLHLHTVLHFSVKHLVLYRVKFLKSHTSYSGWITDRIEYY